MLKHKSFKLLFILSVLISFLVISCGEKSEETNQQQTTEQEKSALETSQNTQSSDATAVKVDPDIPHYTKVPGISGNLSSIGSDTMNNLLTLW